MKWTFLIFRKRITSIGQFVPVPKILVPALVTDGFLFGEYVRMFQCAVIIWGIPNVDDARTGYDYTHVP